MERVAKAARALKAIKAVSTVTQEGEVSAVTLRIGPQQSRHRRSRQPVPCRFLALWLKLARLNHR